MPIIFALLMAGHAVAQFDAPVRELRSMAFPRRWQPVVPGQDLRLFVRTTNITTNHIFISHDYRIMYTCGSVTGTWRRATCSHMQGTYLSLRPNELTDDDIAVAIPTNAFTASATSVVFRATVVSDNDGRRDGVHAWTGHVEVDGFELPLSKTGATEEQTPAEVNRSGQQPPP